MYHDGVCIRYTMVPRWLCDCECVQRARHDVHLPPASTCHDERQVSGPVCRFMLPCSISLYCMQFATRLARRPNSSTTSNQATAGLGVGQQSRCVAVYDGVDDLAALQQQYSSVATHFDSVLHPLFRRTSHPGKVLGGALDCSRSYLRSPGISDSVAELSHLLAPPVVMPLLRCGSTQQRVRSPLAAPR